MEVYANFLRDGVNFAPQQTGNSYSIDITGLKTLFTNTPFAVQLVASSDSMQYLTNAFIIDATANTTQSVVYPSTPPVHDQGDTTWIRGHGGGLSTASGPLNTTHLKIMGNQAAHGGDKVTGYNFASTISAGAAMRLGCRRLPTSGARTEWPLPAPRPRSTTLPT
jgi:hypothetical protein